MVAALAAAAANPRPVASQSPPAAQQGTAAIRSPEATDAPDAGSVRYLALGDSVTQGVGAPDEQTGSFPALLAEKWRGEGCEVELQNAGISGYTAGQVLDEQVPQIEEFKPTLITFQAGGNDLVNGVSTDDYRSDVQAVLDAATGSGARVIVLAQNEWFRAPGGSGLHHPGGAGRASDVRGRRRAGRRPDQERREVVKRPRCAHHVAGDGHRRRSQRGARRDRGDPVGRPGHPRSRAAALGRARHRELGASRPGCRTGALAPRPGLHGGRRAGVRRNGGPGANLEALEEIAQHERREDLHRRDRARAHHDLPEPRIRADREPCTSSRPPRRS